MKFLMKLSLGLSLICPSFAFADQLLIEKPDVKAFIQHMQDKHRFSQEKLIALFSSVKPQPQVIENMKHPLEKETWKMYQRVFIEDTHIAEGAAFRKKFHNTLVKAEKKYGVPGSIIIATLGVETLYGKHSGGYRVLDSLSNLSFTGQPRANYFRKELEQFLLLTREQHLDPFKVQGSYAGAIGAPQFMPSSYRYYAASFSKKSQIDLIHNTQDAIVSVANYYKEHGWKGPHFVAYRATITGTNYLKLRNPDGSPRRFSSSKLAAYGIKPERKIPKGYKVKLIELEGLQGKEYWLVFHDFDVIKRYNPSNLYAMAVFQLSRNILTYKKEKTS
jgi:membrane-bound lytic murein transglycosylase B